MREDVIYTLSGMYPESLLPELTRVPLEDLPGTNLYCSDEAAEAIMEKMAAHPSAGIHLIDHGNYHYLTGLFLKTFKEPVTLVVFDHHTDLKEDGMFGLLSCGNWIRMVLEDVPEVEHVILIGPPAHAMDEIDEEYLSCISMVSEEDILEDVWKQRLNDASEGRRIWLSVDLDILSEEDFLANWDQGEVSIGSLCEMISFLLERTELAGADLCGGEVNTFDSRMSQVYDTLYQLIAHSGRMAES